MKPPAPAFLAVTVLLCTAPARAHPVTFDLPPRPVWCATSQSFAVDENREQGPTSFAAVLFNALYARIEKAAIDLRVPSLGIPFAESLQVQSEPIAAPAAPGSAPAAPPPPRYVLRVCANVPPDLLPPAEALRVETFVLPAAKVYAALCDAADENPCRQALQAKMQADLKLTRAQLEVVQWQVVQPISERSDVDGLRAGLTDFKARPLNSDVPAPLLLRDKLILWATAPSGG